jgi:hypothetical protein
MTQVVKGCTVKGKIIQQLFFSDEGVLIMEGNALKFIDPLELEQQVIRICTPGYEGKLTFISNEFGLVDLLNPDETYRLEFNNNMLAFLTLDGEVALVIEGMIA